jgi:hypothetical protein
MSTSETQTSITLPPHVAAPTYSKTTEEEPTTSPLLLNGLCFLLGLAVGIVGALLAAPIVYVTGNVENRAMSGMPGQCRECPIFRAM